MGGPHQHREEILPCRVSDFDLIAAHAVFRPAHALRLVVPGRLDAQARRHGRGQQPQPGGGRGRARASRPCRRPDHRGGRRGGDRILRRRRPWRRPGHGRGGAAALGTAGYLRGQRGHRRGRDVPQAARRGVRRGPGGQLAGQHPAGQGRDGGDASRRLRPDHPKGAAYADYVRRTSGFIPWPPR